MRQSDLVQCRRLCHLVLHAQQARKRWDGQRDPELGYARGVAGQQRDLLVRGQQHVVPARAQHVQRGLEPSFGIPAECRDAVYAAHMAREARRAKPRRRDGLYDTTGRGGLRRNLPRGQARPVREQDTHRADPAIQARLRAVGLPE